MIVTRRRFLITLFVFGEAGLPISK